MPPTTPLIAPSEFIGLDDVVHLAAGGESPMLKSHRQALDRFLSDKAKTEGGRSLLDATYERARRKAARLIDADPAEVAFLSSASEGINLLVYALDWQPGDNVVVGDVEFPSDTLPWTNLERHGVEVKIVRHDGWRLSLDDIAAALDDRTRVVAVSQVSYLTGERLDVAALSEIVRGRGALLLVDATHAGGVVPVEARHADILVCACYKWLLAAHGTAIFYWNRERLPALKPPFLGWNTGVTIPTWQEPTWYTLPEDASRFVPGNPSFIGTYLLENALDRILEVGVPDIERHALALSGLVWEELNAAGWELMTPEAAADRAGNVCFIADDVQSITSGLAERGILVWGDYGDVNRVRVSTHLYNTEADVRRFLDGLRELVRPLTRTAGDSRATAPLQRRDKSY